ncbi:lipocalin family protein [Flavobacterium psychrotrophum]|uniref:lipocalin family protein n=1 Tax=Flavobacterium psychrotrophum TaxID=2294119 RepID=UPI000E30EE67|nr:lipocalin family protein [Flavobacterium psychrotrophum]
MKKTLLILSCLAIIGCSNDDKAKETTAASLIGNWQLTAQYGSDGGSNSGWVPVQMGYAMKFNENGTFTSQKYAECTEGTYTVSGNKLKLDYGCEGFTTGAESPAGIFVEEVSFENGSLILNPTYATCDEGCWVKFERTGEFVVY